MRLAKFIKAGTVLAIMLLPTIGQSEVRETPAKYAYLFDFETGTVLLDKGSDAKMFPASMTKIMTAFLVFEKLKDGSLSLDDTFYVSEKAWRKSGSKMFVEVGKSVRVEDLLRGIIIQSGNDATIVVAEGIAGSEEAFAKKMNEKARALGLTATNFTNASGWPDENHYSSARDLGVLARALITNFPDYYHFYSETEFEFADIKQSNRNPLLYQPNLGADGLKTGYTKASGYGLVASASREGRRLVLVVNGLESAKQRAVEAANLINWGFFSFENYRLFSQNTAFLQIPIWLGDKDFINAGTNASLPLTLSTEEWENLSITARFQSPIAAPIKAGTQIGQIIINGMNGAPITLPLLAMEEVGKLGFVQRIGAALNYLIWGAPDSG